MKPSKPQMVKEQNLAYLVNVIRSQGSLSQREIAQLSGLSVVTINKLLPELVAQGQLLESAEGVVTGGRRALTYKFNPIYKLLLVVQFLEEDEQFYMKIYLSDLRGEIIYQEKYLGTALSWIGIKDVIQQTIEKYPKISGIAFGIPGVEQGGVAQIVEFPQLLHVDLVTEIKTTFDLPVIIENDMNAAIFGYATVQEQVADTLVGLYYPNSFPPGAGVFLNGQPLRGRNNFIGEISYLPLTAENQWRQIPVSDINLAENLFQVIQTCICMYDPHTVMVFANSKRLNDKKIAVIREQLSARLPMVKLPEIELWQNFTTDYLQGLIAQGLKLIST